MKIKDIKKLIRPLRHTPLHPQWLINRNGEATLTRLLLDTDDLVLDIGCADKAASQYVRDKANYIGLDYNDTASEWYETVPDVYADAQALPFAEESVGTVLLLDVLEHLPDPELCMAEICRVLKPQGKIIIQVPFLYPLHDVPLDFQRWTRYGLERLLSKHRLTITELHEDGNIGESWAILTNLALSKTLVWCIGNKHPLLVLAVFIPFLIPVVNLAGYLAARIFPDISYIPYRYRVVSVKD
ncbi:MAG: Methyltransferase type 11 [Gammaproteobacteria bacterium]|nr:Methyltransferase type 11 [Gammaproteobacteria bacterium]